MSSQVPADPNALEKSLEHIVNNSQVYTEGGKDQLARKSIHCPLPHTNSSLREARGRCPLSWTREPSMDRALLP